MLSDVTTDDDVALAYQVEGPEHAPVLLLANSISSNWNMWDPQMPHLREHFRVVRYDMRGHGGSAVPPGPYSLGRLGQDALAVLDELGVTRAHVCGLSLGGMVAQWLAIHHPARVERAVLANTAARIGTETEWAERMEAVRVGGMAAVRDAVVARFLSEPFRVQHPATTEAVAMMVGATDPVGYIGCCAALRDADLGAEVAAIRAPSLIITSALDPSTPPAQAEALQAAITGSQLVLLPDAAHLSNVEQPEQFTHAVLDFLLP